MSLIIFESHDYRTRILLIGIMDFINGLVRLLISLNPAYDNVVRQFWNQMNIAL